MCWNLDDDGVGTCVELCTGNSQNPMCGPPGATCVIVNNASLTRCLLSCEPILQDCQGCEVCIGDPNGDGFICVLVASGAGRRRAPCEFANVCNPGLMCVNPMLYPNPDCSDSIGCCAVQRDRPGPRHRHLHVPAAGLGRRERGLARQVAREPRRRDLEESGACDGLSVDTAERSSYYGPSWAPASRRASAASPAEANAHRITASSRATTRVALNYRQRRAISRVYCSGIWLLWLKS